MVASTTPSLPVSSFSKAVSLNIWWLIKSDTDADGKRLAVQGLNAHEIFTSAPIVKRYDAFTVKAADGITVMLQGFIHKTHTHRNGFPPEVSRCFLVGFPSNWDYYADGDFQNKPACPIVQLKHLSHAMGSGRPLRLGALLDFLTPTCAPEKTVGCAARITHDSKETVKDNVKVENCLEKGLHCGVRRTSLDVDDRVVTQSAILLQKAVFEDLSPKENFQQHNLSENYAGKFRSHAGKARGHDCHSLPTKMNLPLESPTFDAGRNVDNAPKSADMAVKVSSSIHRVLRSKHGKRFADCAPRSWNHAQRIRLDYTSDAEVRRNSNRNEADSPKVDPCTVLETTLKCSTSGKEQELNNKHHIYPTDCLLKSVSNNGLPMEGKDLHEKPESMQRRYALRRRSAVNYIE